VKVSVTNREIIKLAAPIALAMLIPQVNFITNNAFLGRFGERELGVSGITGIYYLILSMVGYGLSSGMQIQMARRAGENDKEGLAKIFANGIVLAALLALGLIFLSFFFATEVLGKSLHDPENIRLSIRYLYVRCWGLPFLLVTQLFNAFYISIGRSKLIIWGSLTATIANIFFDYGLIFGHFGFPMMGLMGAGIASIISEFIYCLTMVGIYFFRKLHISYRLHLIHDFSIQLCRQTLTVAAPLVVQFLFSIGGWQIFFIFIEHEGQRELAASQILRSLFGIIGLGTWSLASACSAMVSNIIGQGSQHEVMSLIMKIVKLSVIYTVVIGGLLFVFSEPFLSMYTNDSELVRFAVPSMRVIIVATLIMAVATVMFNGVLGTGNTAVNLFMEVTSVCIYLIYCYIIIERMRSPLYICWMSEGVYWTSLITFSFFYLRSGRWRGKTI